MSDEQEHEFRKFADWVNFWGIRAPATGLDVADYLTDMLMEGATLDEINGAAVAILAYYDRRRQFIDRVAVQAALDMCREQLTPGRVLN